MSGDMVPFRGEIAFVFAGEDMTHAEETLQEILQAVEATGGTVQVASIRQMEKRDVIHGSPLDEALGSRID